MFGRIFPKNFKENGQSADDIKRRHFRQKKEETNFKYKKNRKKGVVSGTLQWEYIN